MLKVCRCVLRYACTATKHFTSFLGSKKHTPSQRLVTRFWANCPLKILPYFLMTVSVILRSCQPHVCRVHFSNTSTTLWLTHLLFAFRLHRLLNGFTTIQNCGLPLSIRAYSWRQWFFFIRFKFVSCTTGLATFLVPIFNKRVQIE